MQRHLILAGAGHSHLQLLDNLEEYIRRGCKVTLISPGDFWYSGMGPGVLSRTYRSEEHRVDTAKLVRQNGGAFIRDAIKRVDAVEKTVELQSGKTIRYDLLSLNVGSGVSASAIQGAEEFGWTVKPIENLTRLRCAVEREAPAREVVRVLVAGGGAAGCEVAINLWHLLKQLGVKGDIRIVTSGPALMEKEGTRPGQEVEHELDRLKISVSFGRKATRVTKEKVYLDDGSAIACDFFVVATGVRPPCLFRDSMLPTAADGSLLVNRYLQSTAAPKIFGAGDCVGFEEGPPPRVGVYAVRESQVLHRNLLAALDGRRLCRFRPPKSYLLILNLGDGAGLLFWRGHACRARWAFRLKNWLDCRFVKKYQPR